MENRIKVLITIDWFLPGTASGGPVRSYTNLIEHLKDDFEFRIVTRDIDFGSNTPYKEIESNTWIDFNEYTKVYYISQSRLNRKQLKELIYSTNFDVAYINGIYSWFFSIAPIPIIKKIKKPIIISARGMLNVQAFSVKRNKKKVYLSIAKLMRLYDGVVFHATNNDEMNSIRRQIGSNSKVFIAPNLPRKLEDSFNGALKLSEPRRFVNVARISKEKGTLRMLEGLLSVNYPLLLDIYGPIYDESYWARCESLISKLPKKIIVTYKGILESEDVPQILKKYHFFVMLSEGENFGHAILEAFSAGLPVIISNKTPWLNLEAQHIGWDIDADHSNNLIETYNKALLMDKDDYEKWSLNSYNYAKAFITDPTLIEQNKALFLNTIKENTK